MSETIKNEPDLFISPAFIAAAEIRVRKHNDYGGLEGYFPFGDKSFAHELNKKTLRLVSLLKSGNDINFESIDDNLLDLINYASYYYEFLLSEKMGKEPFRRS